MNFIPKARPRAGENPVKVHKTRPKFVSGKTPLLFLVFPLSEALQNREPGLLCVGNGQWLQLLRLTERRNHFANRPFASRAGFQFRRANGPAQGEFSTADRAISLTQFIFVVRHGKFFRYRMFLTAFSTAAANPSPRIPSPIASIVPLSPSTRNERGI